MRINQVITKRRKIAMEMDVAVVDQQKHFPILVPQMYGADLGL